MNVDREYRVRITVAADNAPVRATADAVGELGGTTKKTAAVEEEASKVTEKHGGHLREMHRLCHALNGVLPGLGTLMQAAFSPVGAAISLAVMVLHAFKEKLKEVNAELDRMEEQAAKPLTHRLEAMRDGTVRAAGSMAELRERLDQAAHSEQTLKRETEKAITASHEQAGTAQTLAEATKQNELAHLELLHAAGLVSEQNYADQRLAIQIAYIEKKRQIEQREEMAAIMIRKRELEEAGLRQPGLTKAAEAAQEKQEKAMEDLASLRTRAEIEEDKKASAEALKKWDASKEAAILRDARAGIGKDIRLGYDQPGARPEEIDRLRLDREQAARLQDERDKLQAAADLAKRAWEQAPGAEARKKVAAEAASREAGRAAERAEANQALITEGASDLTSRRSLFEAHKRATGELASLQEATLLMDSAAKGMGSFADVALRLANTMGGLGSGQVIVTNRVQAVEAQVRALQEQLRGSFAP